MPRTPLTGSIDLTPYLDSPAPGFGDKMPEPRVHTLADQKDAEEKRKKKQPKASLKDITEAAIDTQWVGFAVARQAARQEFKPDPNFKLNDDNLKEFTKDIPNPEDYYSEFEGVRSLDEGLAKAAEIRSFLDRQGVLTSRGTGVAIAASVTASLLDPVALGASVATEGVAAPFIYGAKATRLTRAVRAGIVSMAATAPIEGYMAAQDPTQDWKDATTGVLLAGGFGALVKYKWPGDIQPQMDSVMKRAMKEAQAEELRAAGAKATDKTEAALPGMTKPDGTIKTPEEVNREWFAANERSADFTHSPKTRIDRAADVFSSASEKVRKLGHALFDDPNATKGSIQGESAESFMRTNYNAAMRRYTLAFTDNFEKYTQEMKRLGKEASKEAFDEEIARVMRGGTSDSQFVNKMAAFQRKEQERIHELQRNPGKGSPVKGSEAWVDNYLTRRYSSAKIAAKMAQAGGKAAVVSQLARAMKNVSPELATELGERIVDISMKSRRSSLDFSFLGKPKEDVVNLLTREHGLKAPDAQRIADALERLTKGSDAGNPSQFKSRIELDELEIEDLLENSASSLFRSYARSGYGWAALARQGIDSEATFKRLLGEAVDEKAAMGQFTEVDNLGLKASKNRRELKNLEEAFDFIVGRSVGEDPTRLSAAVGRMVRKTNYARLMNMMGISVLFEGMKVLSQTGLKATLRQMPEMLAIRRSIRDGKFIDELSEETAQLTGWLNEADVRVAHSRIEEFGVGGEVKQSWLSKGENLLDKAGQITSNISLANWADGYTRRLAGKAMLQSFLDAARTGKPHTLGKARLAEIGIDDDLMDAIRKEFMKPGGASWNEFGKLKKLNIENWDHETRIRFGIAVRRWGSYIIQEQTFGSLPGFASTTGGKLLMQFRSFVMGAWVKQTHHMVKHGDFRSGMDFLATLVGGYLSYMAYVQLTAMGRDDKDKYLERMLDEKTVYAQAFARSAGSSFLPGLIDTGADAFGFEKLFDHRNSGLSSNFITGNPTYDLIFNKGYGALKGAIRSTKEGEVDDDTARNFFNLLPFQNWFGLKSFINNLVNDLPDHREE